MSDVTADQLVQFAGQQKPVDFKTSFDNMMMDRIATALEAKRQELAQTYFDSKKAETDEDTETTA